jgi:hypothetical protein
MTRFLLLASVCASATGCGTVGAFHQAALFRECRAGDDGCKSVAPGAPLAVGAHLRPAVEIEIAGSATPNVRIVSGRPDIISAEGDVLVGVRPGLAPVLITADDGSVIDFLHVWVAAPTRLAVEAAPARGEPTEEVAAPIQLVVGESRWLVPAVFGGAQRLAGANDVGWTVDCGGAPSCASIALLTDGALDRRRLVARAPGKARIALEGLGLTTTLDVEVVP